VDSTGTRGSKSLRTEERYPTYLIVLDEASWLCQIECAYVPTNGDNQTDSGAESSNKKSQTAELGSERGSSGGKRPLKVRESVQRRNGFELLRKALWERGSQLRDSNHRLPDECIKFVVVVADTTSRVGNFAPTVEKFHPHIRRSLAAANLFPVVYLPLSFDALAPSSKQNVKESFRTLSALRFYGRPLWVRLEVNPVDKLISSLELEYSKHLALLGCRVVLRILRSSFASELVAKSTAVCTFVNFERDALECEFLSEPVVSEASAAHCDSLSLSLWATLREALLQHHIETGHLGELVAQKVLLDVYDQCVSDMLRTSQPSCVRFLYIMQRNSEETIPSVALVDLLKWFYTEENSDLYQQVVDDLNAMGQQGAHVFFNHFVQLKEEISLDVIEQAMRRCCALVLGEGATGADLCLPAFNPNTNKLSLVVWIQVKNRNPKQMGDTHKQAAWWSHLHPQKIMPPSGPQVPSLSILFSVSPSNTKTIEPPGMSMGESLDMRVAFDEATVSAWRQQYHGRKRRVDFWTWVRNGNGGSLQRQRKAWSQRMSELETKRDSPFTAEELEVEAVKCEKVVTATVSYTCMMMPDILERNPSLYDEHEIQTIKSILQADHQQLPAFDGKQRMSAVSHQIEFMIDRLKRNKSIIASEIAGMQKK